MGWDGKKLTSPFTKIAVNGQGDLQRALGVSITGMTQANLFANGTINKWAKYKAFKNNVIYLDKYSDNNSQRLAGLKAQNYGFSSGITSFTSATALHSGWSTSTWTYVRPTINNGYLRALDFDGYVSGDGWGMNKYKDSNNRWIFNGPFDSYIEVNETVGNGNTMSLGISSSSSGAAENLLSLDDFSGMSGFFSLKDWYFGVALIKKGSSETGSNDYFYVLNSSLTGNISESISFTSTVPNASYYVVPILAQAHTSNAWVGASSFPTRCVTLDAQYVEITKTSTASGFEWGQYGAPYISGGVLKVKVRFKNSTGSAITVNKMFTYTMTDDASMQTDYYLALTDACQYWVNSKAEKTNGAGIKVNNVVVGAYKQLATSLTVAAGAETITEYTLTTGSTDALGYSYNGDSDVRLCLQYNSTNYVCDKLY